MNIIVLIMINKYDGVDIYTTLCKSVLKVIDKSTNWVQMNDGVLLE